MCNINLKIQFNKDIASKIFEEKSIDIYKNFEKAIDISKKEKDKHGTAFLYDILATSNRYIQNVAQAEDLSYFLKMDNLEAIEKRKSLETQRKLTHNSLISKINSTKRYFKDKKAEKLLNLPTINESNRFAATKYASNISIGEYLVRDR